MITTPTVFILGAGASEPYGFPVGTRLKDSVVWDLQRGKGTQLAQAGATPDEIASFVDDLSQSGAASIDAFLEHRKDLVNVGKMAIAQALIPAEKMDRLFMLDLLYQRLHPNEQPVANDRFARDWYPYLWEEMRTTFDRLGKNAVSFITFNYDRSLEQFLYTVISKTYQNEHTANECARATAKFPIVHVHGSLGRLPWQDGDGTPREYTPGVTPVAIRGAAETIQIVSEVDAETPEFEKARTLIKKAGQVVFLGFGYHEDNLRKLNAPNVFRKGKFDQGGNKRKRVMGSARGLESGELERVEDFFRGTMSSLGKPDGDALLFLRRNARMVF